MKFKEKSMTKIISLLMAIIVLAISSQSVTALSNISSFNKKEIRVSEVMKNKIIELEENNAELHPEEGEVDTTILNTKKISDMDGNIYTLTECEPTGYMIFHDQSGIFVESSLKSISPYIGLEDKLFYLGPGEYYQNDNSKLKHTILDKSISLEYSNELKDISNEFNDILLKNKDYNIVNYINGIKNDIPLNSNNRYRVSSTKTYNGMTCVKGYKFFTLLQSCGYNTDGTCGYIAAAMLLSYYKRYYGSDIVEDKYLSCRAKDNDFAYSISDDLHKSLIKYGKNLGIGNSTDSGKIKKVIDAYLKDRGMKKDYVEGIIPFNNNFTIAGSIDNGHPVIWFGNVFNNSYNNQTNINHAIVVYGYSWSGLSPEYVAHFGWNGANEVYFSGILGSLFAFTSNSWEYI